ncbi:unnamed protein product, partial [Effrenium voratum]
MPGMPFSHFCPQGSDWSASAYNWCQLPWCYVSPECVTARGSSVFAGSPVAYFSYDTCGNTPNCYSDFDVDARCPYDPHNVRSYTIYKSNGCECSFTGRELPQDVWLRYPLEEPGRYANVTYVRIYGTSCASWDTLPGTPWSEYCLPGSDWCATEYNWCQVPWCFVGSSCSTRIRSTIFNAPGTEFFSYDTCLSSPNCAREPYDPACPFDLHDNAWSTAADCPDSWSDVCSCIYQGSVLPADLYRNFPKSQPGRYSSLQNIPIYGTSCASWDILPETPFQPFCPPGMDWSSKSFNWCQLPWCYVDSSCVTKVPTAVFDGHPLYYSYDACGNAPDCYNYFDDNPKCPYDPYGTRSYLPHKGGDCACQYQGYELPFAVFSNFPAASPGQFSSLPHVPIYGTTCAAWDQLPGTPLAGLCPQSLDWCNRHNNWCQLLWCYVGPNCSTRIPSSTFQGSEARFYSYDTCLSTPDCKHEPFDVRCPFDSSDAGWSTPQVCTTGFQDVCECIFQGGALPADVYSLWPSQDPGKYVNHSAIALYGTSCAAWDQVPGTPKAQMCPPDADWASPEFNWCQLPWCFVGSTCASRIPSNVFNGSGMFYSYDVCGDAPDCYHDFGGNPRCPFDPTRSLSFALHKTAGCQCKYHGLELPSEVYTAYPTSDPGRYAMLPNVKFYGTSCAAWDQMPATPWASYCPVGADWCHTGSNWCQLPWCYVGQECASKIPTLVFEGADATFYSYDTCFSTPNCLEDHTHSSCPYDRKKTGWATSSDCKNGWTDVCTCAYQGSVLPADLYGQQQGLADMANIALYGTSCAAWDQIPGTPWSHKCPPGSDWSGELNWCQVPWCYVNSSCPSRMPSKLFGSVFFSYDTCGNAPDCYGGVDKCPFDPHGMQRYTVHKANGCECTFHGGHLPPEAYMSFPEAEPGKFQNLSSISIYGTTCAAWDQMPTSPWASYCPLGADWCSSEFNWCQLPWCFVSSSCSSGIPSTLFTGFNLTELYSYDTCMSAPDCLNFPYDTRCPFDKLDLNWSTAAECRDGWTDTPGVPITSFDVAVELGDIWSFEAPKLLDSVMLTSGLAKSQVLLGHTQYRIAISYALLWAAEQLSDSQMTAAAAIAAGVSASRATAASSRRLSEDQGDEENRGVSTRRLQNVFQIAVYTDNAADLASLDGKISSKSNLEAALTSLGISALTEVAATASQQ